MNRPFPPGMPEEWRYGRCYAMARALNALLGWPIRGFSARLRNGRTGRVGAETVVHAFVGAPDGRCFDASGFFDEAELVEEFVLDHEDVVDPMLLTFRDAEAFAGHLDRLYADREDWPGIREGIPAREAAAMALARRVLLPLALCGGDRAQSTGIARGSGDGTPPCPPGDLCVVSHVEGSGPKVRPGRSQPK